MKRFSVASLALCCVQVLLSGCGGGGDGGDGGGDANPPPQGSAEGVYGGNLTGGLASDFQALVLENGDIWSLYGTDNGSIFYVEGFVQGRGTTSGSHFNASSVKDFGFAPALSGSMASTFDAAAKTLTGTVTSDGGVVLFSGGPIPGSLYQYDTPASLATISGHWDTVSTDGEMVSINISASGALSLSANGCLGTGTVTPRASGKNVFDISVTFGGAPCALPNQTATGIALGYPLTTGQTQFIAAATDSTRTVGIAVFGIR